MNCCNLYRYVISVVIDLMSLQCSRLDHQSVNQKCIQGKSMQAPLIPWQYDVYFYDNISVF